MPGPLPLRSGSARRSFLANRCDAGPSTAIPNAATRAPISPEISADRSDGEARLDKLESRATHSMNYSEKRAVIETIKDGEVGRYADFDNRYLRREGRFNIERSALRDIPVIDFAPFLV